MQIQISRETYAKVMHWVNKSNDEVSGFGKVIYHAETGVFQIVDAFLLKQVNGAAHTDIEGESLAKLMYTTKDQPGELKWWWHSHVNMNVFWSGTDTATIKELGGQGWITATVFNKKEEMRSALCYQATTPFGSSVELQDEVDTFIIDDISEEVTKEWDKEYDANVTKKVYTSYGGNTHWQRGPSEYDWRKNEYQWPEEKEDTLLNPLKKEDDGAPNVGKRTVEELKDEYQTYMKEGYYGFGAAQEAKIVGMSKDAFVKLLIWGTREEINKIDEKLERAVMSGELA